MIPKLAANPDLQKDFLRACIDYPEIAFDVLFWTFNPRNPAGKRNIPFILRPQQRLMVKEIKKAIDEGHDLLVDKSRDEGATWIITAVFFLYWLLVPDSIFIVGSRKEELVDKAGNRDSLFYRFLYLNENLPEFLKVHEAIKTHLHFENPRNGSVIHGESTNENFGAGGRALAVMLDEFGRVDFNLAQSIRETVSDVTPCCIYNSTHFYGRGHPFAKLLYSNKVKVVKLPWWKNPEKSKGLYRSPDINELKILDIKYYKYYYPKIAWQENMLYSELEKDLLLSYPEAEFSFRAEGDEKFRAPWYDAEEKRRDPRDIAQNIDMNPVGAGDCFFDPNECMQIRQRFIKEPKYRGEIEYELSEKYKISDIKFNSGAGKKHFLWWAEQIKNRPNQHFNYIVACDIALGTGASNSVAGIYNVNTGEKVGLYVNPSIGIDEFADQVIAICHWVGGANHKPFLIWEANGPGGAFGKRILKHGYSSCYTMRIERHKTRRKQKKYGWYSNRQVKYDMLLDLRLALSAGLKDNNVHKKLIVYDESTVTEYEDYIFYENGEVGLSTSLDESVGARAAHGDRVIADGLFVLALSDQPKSNWIKREQSFENSFAYRRNIRKNEQKKKEYNGLPWLFGED